MVIATKGGINKSAPDSIKADASPEFLRSGVKGSLQRLKLEQIDLYQLHRPDPKVAFTESIGALKELRDEGKIRHIGLCNVSVELAWLLHRAPNIILIPGTTTIAHLEENIAAADIELTSEQVEALNRLPIND